MKHQHLLSEITDTLTERTGFFILLLILIFGDPVFCQDNTFGNPVKRGPVITFNCTSHDFGTIKYGERAVHFFVFSNDGESPLVILNVRTACGCTVQSNASNTLTDLKIKGNVTGKKK